MQESHFTWKKIYREIAERLLPYRNRQAELIDILKECIRKGLKTVRLIDVDKDGKEFPCEVMDPFTFFANWNRASMPNRRAILQEIKQVWSLSSPLPDDFDGTPAVFPLNSWFHTYAKDAESGDVDALWDLFEAVIEKRNPQSSFDRCLRIRTVGKKITQGLFWVAPDEFVSLDSVLKAYLETKGFKGLEQLHDLNWNRYQKIKDEVVRFTNSPFPELSYQAWLEQNKIPEAPEPVNQNGLTNKYWIVAPGKGARHWEELYEEGLIALGWDKIGDYRKYKTRDEIVEAIRKDTGNEGSLKNSSLACWQFLHEMKPGDVLITKKGRMEFLGWGVVQSDYDFIAARAELRSVRKVKWLRKGSWIDTVHPIVLKTLTDITKYPEYVERLKKLILQNVEVQNSVQAIDIPVNMILFGPPGTGKTYTSISYAVSIVESKPLSEVKKERENDPPAVKKRFDEYMSTGKIALVTFHQSFAYEDFVEGIKPSTEGGEIRYDVRDGVLKRLAKSARENWKGNYVLIIDEISRGNVAATFGELITLIEEDKREGGALQLETILPYSRERFTMPRNLFILGTMNTADRSVEALDTALRRRFAFCEIPPDEKLLGAIEGLDTDIAGMMDAINERIERLLDRDHRIGHSYFMSLKDSADPLKELKEIFAFRIIPLLQEYFYNDPVKMGMVLGKQFVERVDDIEFALGFEDDFQDGGARTGYRVRNALDFTDESAFLSIISEVEDE